MYFKSGDSFSHKPSKHRCSLLSIVSALSVSMLTLTLIPLSSYASRSQSANTSPNPEASNIAAAAAANVTRANDGITPVAEPPEESTDRGFTTDDFLHFDDGRIRKPKTVSISTTVPRKVEAPTDFNLRIRVTVPQNLDAVDKFVAYPYPTPLPIPQRPPGTKSPGASTAAPAPGSEGTSTKPVIPSQAYDKMPATRQAIRNLILQTGFTNRTRKARAYPSGGWRWQMAYLNALHKSHRDEPAIITEIYPFIDTMEPLVKLECEKFDDLEEDRQRRYETAYEDFQLNRSEAEYEAVKKGYYPVQFNLTQGWRGQRAKAEIKLGPGTWYLTGTHKVAGLTYYWQQPVSIVNGQVEEVELNWINALVIEGGW